MHKPFEPADVATNNSERHPMLPDRVALGIYPATEVRQQTRSFGYARFPCGPGEKTGFPARPASIVLKSSTSINRSPRATKAKPAGVEPAGSRGLRPQSVALRSF